MYDWVSGRGFVASPVVSRRTECTAFDFSIKGKHKTGTMYKSRIALRRPRHPGSVKLVGQTVLAQCVDAATATPAHSMECLERVRPAISEVTPPYLSLSCARSLSLPPSLPRARALSLSLARALYLSVSLSPANSSGC